MPPAAQAVEPIRLDLRYFLFAAIAVIHEYIYLNEKNPEFYLDSFVYD